MQEFWLIRMAKRVKTYRQQKFTKQELKILVYNKMKRDGMGYDQAVKQVKSELKICFKNAKAEEKKNKKSVSQEFKEDFKKISERT